MITCPPGEFYKFLSIHPGAPVTKKSFPLPSPTPSTTEDGQVPGSLPVYTDARATSPRWHAASWSWLPDRPRPEPALHRVRRASAAPVRDRLPARRGRPGLRASRHPSIKRVLTERYGPEAGQLLPVSKRISASPRSTNGLARVTCPPARQTGDAWPGGLLPFSRVRWSRDSLRDLAATPGVP